MKAPTTSEISHNSHGTKSVLVTGATRGIGRAIADTYATASGSMVLALHKRAESFEACHSRASSSVQWRPKGNMVNMTQLQMTNAMLLQDSEGSVRVWQLFKTAPGGRPCDVRLTLGTKRHSYNDAMLLHGHGSQLRLDAWKRQTTAM